MEQNDWLEKNEDFFQGKQLFDTKLLQGNEVEVQLARVLFLLRQNEMGVVLGE